MEINSSIEKSDLSFLFGGRYTRRFSHSINRKIDDFQTRLKDLTTPELSYRIKKTESVSKGSICLQEGTKFKSPKFSKAMEPCEDIVCFIATIGSGIEEETVRLMRENRLSDSYILDSMGSIVVENMVDKFYNDMKKKYELKGRGVTLRFSPGYCDWPITEQKKLFRLLGPDLTGVQLTDSCLMQPRKSVSGVFGVLPSNVNLSVSPYNPCLECKKQDCVARRT
jgi:Methionine synthase I, cobalamin-binding domain